MSATNFAKKEARFSQDGPTRTYEADYLVKTDDRADGPQIVRSAALSQIPPGSVYQFGNDYDGGAFAKRPKTIRLVKAEATYKLWLVTIPYSNPTSEDEDEEDVDNPLDEPFKISGSFVRATRAATKDRNGDPLANSADEPWLPAPEVDDSRDTIVIEGNTAYIDLSLRAAARDTVNDAALWGLPARAVKLSAWDWSVEYFAGSLWYIRNRLSFEINDDLWNEIRLDEGFRIKNGTDTEGKTQYVTLMDGEDQPLRNPRLLDGTGDLLAATADPVEIEKEIYDEFDMTQLPIPLNIEFAS